MCYNACVSDALHIKSHPSKIRLQAEEDAKELARKKKIRDLVNEGNKKWFPSNDSHKKEKKSGNKSSNKSGSNKSTNKSGKHSQDSKHHDDKHHGKSGSEGESNIGDVDEPEPEPAGDDVDDFVGRCIYRHVKE